MIMMTLSYPQVVLSAMERSCIPPESAPAQSRTASETIPTSRIETVVRAKEAAKKVILASDWLTKTLSSDWSRQIM